jgi:hypothetical protein
MSLIELKKHLPIAGKGENEMHEIVDLQMHTRDVTAVTGNHVTENRGTRLVHNFMDPIPENSCRITVSST